MNYINRLTVLTVVVFWPGILSGVHGAIASEDDIGNFDNFDGITTRCIISTKRKYAEDMCEIPLATHAKEIASRLDINLEHAGSNAPALPRSGRLVQMVLWEEAAVTAGPAKRIGGALVAHMNKKLKLLIESFAQGKTR